jgi:hypothetical protein
VINYEAFAKAVLQDWPEPCDLDSADMVQMAITHGVLVPVAGGFDPDKHECPYDMSEKGDPWYYPAWVNVKQEEESL